MARWILLAFSSWVCRLFAVFSLAAPLITGCSKVGLTKLQVTPSLLSGYWFSEEQVGFLFYQISVPEALRQDGVIELMWEGRWQDVTSLAPEYRHDSPTCSPGLVCGSLSLAMPEIHSFAMRYRYHRDGPDHDLYDVIVKRIRSGTSLQVFGVYNADNTRVQWRPLHNFPGLAQHVVHDLGLRRRFLVRGVFPPDEEGISIDHTNPWMFDHQRCREVTDLHERDIESDYALHVWDPTVYEVADEQDGICSQVTTDMERVPNHVALARKNPQVGPALDRLTLSRRPAAVVPYVIQPCRHIGDEEFLSFQKQRLGLSGDHEIDLCSEEVSGLSPVELADRFLAKFAAAAPQTDAIMQILVHRNDPLDVDNIKLSAAFARVANEEGAKLSPRLGGVFVYDSHALLEPLGPELGSYVVWCPQVDPTNLAEGCSVFEPVAKRGMFTLSFLPVFPSAEGYRTFRRENKYESLGKAELSDVVVPYREGGSLVHRTQGGAFASFQPEHRLTMPLTSALSYCHLGDRYSMLTYQLADIDQAVHLWDVDESLSQSLALLPRTHALRRHHSDYLVGLSWSQGFLLRYRYQANVNVKIAVVPWSLKNRSDMFFGDDIWTSHELDVSQALLQCKRFCANPFFNEGGEYHVMESWSSYHQNRCYQPGIPSPS